MKLTLENTNAPWLKRAFAIVARELGIEREPWEISIRIEPGFGLRQQAGGATGHDPKNPKKILMWLRDRSSPFAQHDKLYSQLEVFCHEMIHVKQHIRDGLVGGPGGVWWRGQFWPQQVMEIACGLEGPGAVPWEREAYTKMLVLARKVEKELGQ